MLHDGYDREDPALELEARKRLYDLVSRSAGSHFREIERQSGLSTGTVKYHLDYLARRGLITCEKEGNNLRYFPRTFRPQNHILLGLLRQESLRRIILTVLLHEGCSHEELVEKVGLSPSTVSWHLKRLVEKGVMRAVRRGRTKRYALAASKDEIVALIITYRESFLDKLVDRVIDMWETR